MKSRLVFVLHTLLVSLLLAGCPATPTPAPPPTVRASVTTAPIPASSTAPTAPLTPATNVILVDDFSPQPEPGKEVFPFNRLDGDRGAINDSIMEWGHGQVTTTISADNSWGGAWMSLNHPIREGLPINFSAILPAQILPAYQSQITGIAVRIARSTPGKVFKLELKDGDELRWKSETTLNGGEQVLSFDLPSLGNINQLVWVLDRASAGDSIVLDSIAFTATTQITDTATAAFVWSYGMLLNTWDPTTGLARDKARDASREFGAIQVTGSLAAATAQASQLGIIRREDAIQIVSRIGRTLLVDTPRYRGLLPHFVKTSPTGVITIVPNTEWSSVDTVIAVIGLLTAQSSLGLDTSGAEQLRAIDWDALIGPEGMISMGYGFDGRRVGYDDRGKRVEWFWDTFGGESWLVGLAYAGATGKVATIRDSAPPTANGSGFIDELAWLFVPPPATRDRWGTDWAKYRSEAAEAQIRYYHDDYPGSCFDQLDLFGLSAAEVPDPSIVPPGESVYQSFGVGGRSKPNDGKGLMGAPAVVPHYSAVIASLRPQEAIRMWDWLIQSELLSPLNNVESLLFPPGSICDPSSAVWNQLKGSWNLSLQTLGWGRHLAERRGQVPVLWQATAAVPLLRDGYRLLAPREPTATPSPTPGTAAAPTPTPSPVTRECERPDESTVGQTLERSNAFGGQVHGQFGTTPGTDWPAKPGYVTYKLALPQADQLYLRLRYSKHSLPSVPILIYLDDEPAPRASRYLVDQGDWDEFVWTESIPLGSIGRGAHPIRFYTDGQQYGVADLDRFVLAGDPASLETAEFAAGKP
jgi:hypothetical protein